MKNHDFTPKNLIFSNFRGGGAFHHPPLHMTSALYMEYKPNTTTLSIQFQNQIKQIVERGTIDALSLHIHMTAHFPGFVGHFNNKW